ncbi:hypothetical protein JTB14_007055 [Gonioctena quinquepunctata]|nr:hypothetical protein JTB14_007055 [Gonioctena quinquepunctata]
MGILFLSRFKRFDNAFIRPYLVRNHQGAEKILETYSKLAMRDAMEYMRRNASTIGNISGTESMSAIFKNYTGGNLNGSTSFSQLDSSTWNIDMQELEYNPSKKDLTDAKIHHLLAEELVKPYRRGPPHTSNFPGKNCEGEALSDQNAEREYSTTQRPKTHVKGRQNIGKMLAQSGPKLAEVKARSSPEEKPEKTERNSHVYE